MTKMHQMYVLHLTSLTISHFSHNNSGASIMILNQFKICDPTLYKLTSFLKSQFFTFRDLLGLDLERFFRYNSDSKIFEPTIYGMTILGKRQILHLRASVGFRNRQKYGVPLDKFLRSFQKIISYKIINAKKH